MDNQEMRGFITDAIRYWERGRIVYNVVLLAIVAAIFGADTAAFGRIASLDLFLQLFLLAVLANVFYCASYPIDFTVQRSDLRAAWLRVRWVLFLIGTSFAATVAQFVARGLLGSEG